MVSKSKRKRKWDTQATIPPPIDGPDCDDATEEDSDKILRIVRAVEDYQGNSAVLPVPYPAVSENMRGNGPNSNSWANSLLDYSGLDNTDHFKRKKRPGGLLTIPPYYFN